MTETRHTGSRAQSAGLPEANPNPVISCRPDGVLKTANPATKRLLRELKLESAEDILPVIHKGLVKACLKTATPLSEERLVNGRTIVWSYQPTDNCDAVYIYGHDISAHDEETVTI